MEDWDKTRLATTTSPENGRFDALEDLQDDSTRLRPTESAVAGPTVARPRMPERLAPSNTLPPDARLQEYRIETVLGQGGFGITYLATDTNLNAEVAIKEYLPSQLAVRSGDRTVRPRSTEQEPLLQEGLEHFLTEARTLATFRHPNIVRVARFFEANNTAYMVLDYERGRSLDDWWRLVRREAGGRRQAKAPAEDGAGAAPMAEPDLIQLLSPLLDGLARVHCNGILHRDIKPDNILVRDEDGSLVLLDFGAARPTSAPLPGALAMLTPGFAPIEQHQSSAQGPWTDLYAFGATLYWMVTGRRLREAPERVAEPRGEPSAEEAGAGRYSPEFLRAIDWALQVRPQDRPQSVAEFRRALFAAHAASLGLEEALAADAVGGDERSTGKVRSSADRRRIRRRYFRPGSWPIALKMAIALVLAAVLPMSITGYYNYRSSVNALADAERHSLEGLASATAGRIAQLLEDSRRVAAFFAGDPDVARLLAKPTEAAKAALQARFAGFVAANPDVHLLLLMDGEGTALLSTAPEVVGRNFAFREYFKLALAGKPNTTGIIVGAVQGRAGTYVAHPVRAGEGGEVVGVVALRLHAERFDAILAAAGTPTRAPFLIDRDGVLIYHRDPALRFSSLAALSAETMAAIRADQRFRRDRIASLDMPALAHDLVGARQEGTVDYQSTITNAAEVAGFAPVGGHDWVVGVTETRDSFEAPLQEMFGRVLYALVLVGLVFVLLALLFARSIVRPIDRLTAAADALKRGDYEGAHVRVTSQDEVGALGRTFNVMIDVLRQRERERRLRAGEHSGG